MRSVPSSPSACSNTREAERLLGRNEAGEVKPNVNRFELRRWSRLSERRCARLWPRAADDAAGLAVDVDPDYAAVLHELETIGAAVEFRSEIVGAAHERHHPALELRQRHRAALAHVLESPV